MIDRLRCSGDFIHYDAWHNINVAELRSQGCIEILRQDLANHNIAESNIKHYIWIFDLKPEGLSAADMAMFYDFICGMHGCPSKNFRVIFSCVEDVDSLPYPAVCLPDRLIYNGNWFMIMRGHNIDWANLAMTHKLLCLMRRASIGRGHLAKRLMSKFTDQELMMSFGVNGGHYTQDIKQLIHPKPFPLVLDHPVADQVFQHRIDHDVFYRVPVNLVVESSSQIDPGVWTSKFITEKTFKALGWRQFALWYAVPGLVAEIRKLGFDLFDDLFDNHNYDSIDDPWTRMTQVVLLARKFCQQDLGQLRQRHWQRLEHNAQLIERLHQTAILHHDNEIRKLMHEI